MFRAAPTSSRHWRTGPKGHPDGHYATWAKRIIDTRNEHGRGYMAKLLAASPGETRSNVLRYLERAEQLGLYESHNEPGKLGRGRLTAAGTRALGKKV